MARPRKPRSFSASKFTQQVINQTRKTILDNTIKNIEEHAKDAMYQAIKKNVYDRYEPSIYERRGENGGLLSKENIILHRSHRWYTDNTALEKKCYFRIILANIAKPHNLTNGYWANVFTGGHVATVSIEPLSSNKKDILYYWKDQGLVYNLFSDPNAHRWNSPSYLNDSISISLFGGGILKSYFGTNLKKQIKANNRGNLGR